MYEPCKEDLPYLIEPVFARSLERVTHERRRPTEEHSAKTFFCVNTSPRLYVRAVDLGINLTAAFDLVEASPDQWMLGMFGGFHHSSKYAYQVKRCDGCVRGAASCAIGVELALVVVRRMAVVVGYLPTTPPIRHAAKYDLL